MIYLLTVNYYSTTLIERLIGSLPPSQYFLHQVVIVNNSPEDQQLQQLGSDTVRILEVKTNLGFSKACNLGLNWIYSQDPNAIVWVINPDAYLLENMLEKVPTFFKAHPSISILGTLIYTPDGDIWFAGGRFIPRLGAIVSANLLSSRPEAAYVSCDWVSGCSLLINLCHFPDCPQFDPAYFLYYEDFDFCRRYGSQGHEVAVTSQLAVVHEVSSITDRNVAQKFQHSTYSYLLTLERYSNQGIFAMRFLRLMLHALILLGLKPQAAFGKLAGVLSYLGRVIQKG